jgi:hypothetical protein
MHAIERPTVQRPPRTLASQDITAAEHGRFVMARVGSSGWVAAPLLPAQRPPIGATADGRGTRGLCCVRRVRGETTTGSWVLG